MKYMHLVVPAITKYELDYGRSRMDQKFQPNPVKIDQQQVAGKLV